MRLWAQKLRDCRGNFSFGLAAGSHAQVARRYSSRCSWAVRGWGIDDLLIAQQMSKDADEVAMFAKGD